MQILIKAFWYKNEKKNQLLFPFRIPQLLTALHDFSVQVAFCAKSYNIKTVTVHTRLHSTKSDHIASNKKLQFISAVSSIGRISRIF